MKSKGREELRSLKLRTRLRHVPWWSLMPPWWGWMFFLIPALMLYTSRILVHLFGDKAVIVGIVIVLLMVWPAIWVAEWLRP